MRVNLDGVMNAMITPMSASGSVDIPKIAPLVEHQIENGVHSLLALGGTGEYIALAKEQREAAVREVVSAVRGRVPVIAGVLEPGIGQCVAVCRSCIEIGVSALLVLPPFYVTPTQTGIFNFFKKMHDELNFPLIVYNNPARTGTNVLPETYEKMLDEIPSVIGIKECGTFVQALDVIRRAGKRSYVLTGADLVAPSFYAAGGRGGILATACLLPKESVRMYELASSGKFDEALEIHFRSFSLVQLVFSGGFHPAPLKYAMRLCGFEVGELGIPLVEPDAALKTAIRNELEKLGMLRVAS